MINEKRSELCRLYHKWETELKDSQLVNEVYSHPYYLYIPDNWFDSKYRIMIVGEEGFGVKRFDITIEEAQEFNRTYLSSQWDRKNPNYNVSSAFWRRIRKIVGLFDCSDFSITWTNLDKIHRSGKGNCRLRIQERIALHQTPTAILSKEIALLEPTHVIYFGWYGVSLQAELPQVFTELYPHGLGDSSGWEKEKIKVIVKDDTFHIFTYHPGWGQRTRGYEAKVLDTIKKCLKNQSVAVAKN